MRSAATRATIDSNLKTIISIALVEIDGFINYSILLMSPYNGLDIIMDLKY